jgi:alpha-tubulin suppressor-like RCC1 family protein
MSRSLRAVLTTALAAGALIVGPAAASSAAPADDAAGSTFTQRSPLRVLDTRTSGGPVGAGRTVTIDLASRVPATATAVVLNVTGVAPTASTFVTAFPGGTARPTASSLNLTAGEIRANQVTVALGADKTVQLYNNSGSVNLVADLAGHYATGAGSKFTVLAPNRVLDTRWQTPLGPGGTWTLDLRNSVPASATAVTFNLTATEPTASTFVTAWPTGTTRPTASNLNVVAGETRPNQVTVALGANRRLSLYNNSGTIELLADLTGFYTPEYGAEFLPLAPTRVLDTRDGVGTGGPAGPLGQEAKLRVDLIQDVPVNATGVAMNLTGVGTTTSTYVTAWGQYMIQPYGSSTLNLVPAKAIPNAATIAFERERGMELYNHRGSTHLIADLSGVFVVPPTDCAPGCVRAWGTNSYRKLGTSQTVLDSSLPTPVIGLSGVRQVAGGGWGGSAYALLEDGTVRAWGDNGSGQLGNGWTANNNGSGSSVPVPVVGLTGVTAIAAGSFNVFALKSDGTVWGWGSSRLGNGTYDSSSVPVRVAGLTGVVAIASGNQATYAVKSDGTVWAWGWNGSGELGIGTPEESVLSPVRIPSLSGVVAVGAGTLNGYAVKSDGTLWAWGNNSYGQLGNGQGCDPDPNVRCESRVPVQVPGLTGITAVAAGYDSVYALRTDGTVAAWGRGHRGGLGDGVDHEIGYVARIPVAVTGLTDVTAIANFEYGGYALRADGTVWAWGDNLYKSLGNEAVWDFTATPVRVPGLSGVSTIGSGSLAGYAVVANP